MNIFLKYMLMLAVLSSSLMAVSDAEFEAMKKKIAKLEKKVSVNKKLAGADNLKWSVDLRTAVDSIEYKMADEKTEAKNDGLLTNRLWLNMAYAPTDNISFRGRLSYLKAFGAEANNGQRGMGNDNFDWVSNEAVQGDNSLNVKQAFWLYRNETFFGANIPWTASIGRRPATDGLLSNYREDQNRQSALAHTVNVEFDGASFRWNLDKVTPLTGAWIDQLAFDVKLDNEVKKVVIQEYQKHPVTGDLIHVDMMIVQDDVKANFKVPVTVEGTPIGLKNKGLFVFHRKRVLVKALYKDLPKSFHIKIDQLDTGDNVLVRDLDMPSGVSCFLDPRVPVVGVIKAK